MKQVTKTCKPIQVNYWNSTPTFTYDWKIVLCCTVCLNAVNWRCQCYVYAAHFAIIGATGTATLGVCMPPRSACWIMYCTQWTWKLTSTILSCKCPDGVCHYYIQFRFMMGGFWLFLWILPCRKNKHFVLNYLILSRRWLSQHFIIPTSAPCRLWLCVFFNWMFITVTSYHCAALNLFLQEAVLCIQKFVLCELTHWNAKTHTHTTLWCIVLHCLLLLLLTAWTTERRCW